MRHTAKKDDDIRIRLSPGLKQQIVAAATADDMGVSEWMRVAALTVLGLTKSDAASLKSVVARKPRSAKELQSSATAVDS